MKQFLILCVLLSALSFLSAGFPQDYLSIEEWIEIKPETPDLAEEFPEEAEWKVVDIPKYSDPSIEPLRSLETPSFFTLVNHALKNRNYDFLERQIQHYGAQEVCKAYHSKTELLHFAAQGDHHCVIEMLCKNGINPNTVDDCFKETALHTAVFYGAYHAAQILLEYNANPNIKDYEGETPLFKLKSTYSKHIHKAVNIAKLLLAYQAKVDEKSTQQETVLHRYAQEVGYPDLLKLMIEYDAPLFAKNAAGKTAREVAQDPTICTMLDIAIAQKAESWKTEKNLGPLKQP
jgi:hypothetical protein